MNLSYKFNISIFMLVFFLLFASAVLPLSVAAEESETKDSRFSFGLSASISPFLSGDAGKGDNAPNYDDLFKTGCGIALEAECRLCDHAVLVGGIGYEEYSGKTHMGFSFDDLEVVPIYLGCRLQLLSTSPLTPFFSLNMGSAHLSEVDLKWQSIKATYWDSSWVLFGSAGMGLTYQIKHWHFSLGVDLRYQGAPDNYLNAADADACWTLPLHFSLGYSF